MYSYIIDIRIAADEYQKMYQGRASCVRARSRTGERVQFPAVELRRFVTASGINGSFILEVDSNMKLKEIRRLNA